MINANFVLSTTHLGDLVYHTKPQVAVVGRSNVGKSSLINHLLQRKDLARVSATAGRTMTINLYDIDRRYTLVDLPGYGFTKAKNKRAEFAGLINDYLSGTQQLQLVLVIIDAYVGPTDLDIEMFELLRSLDIPTVIIVNKIDKLSRGQAASLMHKLASEHPFATFIPHSIKTHQHRGEILEAIEVALRNSQL